MIDMCLGSTFLELLNSIVSFIPNLCTIDLHLGVDDISSILTAIC